MIFAGRIETTSTHTNFCNKITLRRGGLDTFLATARNYSTTKYKYKEIMNYTNALSYSTQWLDIIKQGNFPKETKDKWIIEE